MWQIIQSKPIWLTAMLGLALIWGFAGITVGGLGGVEHVVPVGNADAVAQLGVMMQSGNWPHGLNAIVMTLLCAFGVTVEMTKGTTVLAGSLAVSAMLTGWLLTLWGVAAGLLLRSLSKMIASALILTGMLSAVAAIGAQQLMGSLHSADVGLYIVPNWIGIAVWPMVAVLIVYLALRQLAPGLFGVARASVVDDGYVWYCPHCAIEMRPNGIRTGEFALCRSCKGRIETERTYTAQKCESCGRNRLVGAVCCYHCGEIYPEEG